MSSLFNASVAASLALHATALLARAGAPLRTGEISRTLGASEAHLSKVLQRLDRAGLVRARRGRRGGFELARPAESITLKELYEATEGAIQVHACPFEVAVCNGGSCLLGDEFKTRAARLVEFMAASRLSDYEQSLCLAARIQG